MRENRKKKMPQTEACEDWGEANQEVLQSIGGGGKSREKEREKRKY